MSVYTCGDGTFMVWLTHSGAWALLAAFAAGMGVRSVVDMLRGSQP